MTALLLAVLAQGTARASCAMADCHHGAEASAMPGQGRGDCCALAGGDCTMICCAIPSFSAPLPARLALAPVAAPRLGQTPLLSHVPGLDPPPPRGWARI